MVNILTFLNWLNLHNYIFCQLLSLDWSIASATLPKVYSLVKLKTIHPDRIQINRFENRSKGDYFTQNIQGLDPRVTFPHPSIQ